MNLFKSIGNWLHLGCSEDVAAPAGERETVQRIGLPLVDFRVDGPPRALLPGALTFVPYYSFEKSDLKLILFLLEEGRDLKRVNSLGGSGWNESESNRMIELVRSKLDRGRS